MTQSNAKTKKRKKELNVKKQLKATRMLRKSKKKKRKDQAFMDKIDALIHNLESPSSSTPASKKKTKKSNSNEKPAICQICGQKFQNFHALAGHKKKHTKGKGSPKKRRRRTKD